MVSKDYKKEILKKIPYEGKNLSDNDDYSGTYLFISFDLVNSTFFKNVEKKWGNIFRQFFSQCEILMKEYFTDITLNEIKQWKMAGDEILFYVPIINEKELYNAPKSINDVLLQTITFLNMVPTEKKGILGVKCTVWTSYVVDSPDHDTQNHSNIIIKNRIFDDYILDFLGPDIDIGFRISKFAEKSQMVIDAKLACLLSKLETELEDDNISKKMRVVSFEKLKGVWDNRHYPIVWYNNNWSDIHSTFDYDAIFHSEIVKEISINKIHHKHNISELTKIFKDVNKLDEIKDLLNGIEIGKKNHDINKRRKSIPRERLSELHLVAICINKKNEILITKRTKKRNMSELWEFGCSQLGINESFKLAMIHGYKTDFKIDIDFYNDPPLPIGYYEINKIKEENRIIPGLIFPVKVISDISNVEIIDKSKHSEIKWVTLENSKKIKHTQAVPDFHNRIEEVYRFIEEKSI